MHRCSQIDSNLPSPVTPLEGLVALDLDEGAEAQLALGDLGAVAGLGAFAAGAVGRCVFETVRHCAFALFLTRLAVRCGAARVALGCVCGGA